MRYTINPVYTLHKYFTSKNVAFNCSYIHISYNIHIYKYEVLVTLSV